MNALEINQTVGVECALKVCSIQCPKEGEKDHYLLWDVFLHNNAYLENCIDDSDCPLEKPICRNGKCEGMSYVISKLGRKIMFFCGMHFYILIKKLLLRMHQR